MLATAESLDQHYDTVSEEVTEMRKAIQILTQNVANVCEQDIRSEVADTLEVLNRQIEGVSTEVTGFRNDQSVQQKVTEASDRDLKGEILTATTDLLNQSYDTVSEEVTEMRRVIETVQRR